jgi:DNA-binding PadR family transcriptional regulator
VAPADTGHLGEFEHLLLLAIVRLEPEAHGAEIRRALLERGGRRASLGAIYATVRRMKEKGLVEVDDVPSPLGGRPRRHVRVTPRGLDSLRETETALRRMRDGLGDRLGVEGA